MPECCRRNWDYRGAQTLVRYTHRTKDWNLGRYVEYLRVKEQGKYDRSGCLIPEALESDEKPWELRVPGIRMPQAHATLGGEPERGWMGGVTAGVRRAAAMLMA